MKLHWRALQGDDDEDGQEEKVKGFDGDGDTVEMFTPLLPLNFKIYPSIYK